jgi:hypothetical protein
LLHSLHARSYVVNTRSTVFSFTVFAWAFSGITGIALETRAEDTPDQRFEKLLAVALKDPEKAKWKELRRAFADTGFYHPYDNDVVEKLREISESIGSGKLKESETALLKLVEQDRFMRFDSLAMLMKLYDKMDQPEKVKKYKSLVDGLTSPLEYPKAGVSFENPIEVLFIQEENLVAEGMQVILQGSLVKNGHHYDILTVTVEGDKPDRQIYFNIDLPWSGLRKSLRKD